MILLKTKKFPSLPQFSVFLNGNLENYKVTYDFEKAKAVLLKKGIDNLIGKRKKIVINPKSIDKILKENPIKEFNTEKLFKPEFKNFLTGLTLCVWSFGIVWICPLIKFLPLTLINKEDGSSVELQ